MNSDQSITFKRLNSIASKKLKQQSRPAELFSETQKEKRIKFDEFFLPESFSLGFGTELYDSFNDEQKLFLNHLSYYIHYFRTTGAELIAVYNNLALSKNISQTNIAHYLQLETQEERDHIKAFKFVMKEIVNHYKLDDSMIKNKLLNQLSYNTSFNSFLMKVFGPKYVTTYFLARGVFNHIGYCYESNILNTVSNNNLIHELTKLHIVDEKRHTAISHSFSSAINEMMEESIQNRLLSSISKKIEDQVINTSFSERYNCEIEASILKNFINQTNIISMEQKYILISLCDQFYSKKNQHISLSDNLDSNVLELINQSQLDSQRKKYWLDRLQKFGLIA